MSLWNALRIVLRPVRPEKARMPDTGPRGLTGPPEPLERADHRARCRYTWRPAMAGFEGRPLRVRCQWDVAEHGPRHWWESSDHWSYVAVGAELDPGACRPVHGEQEFGGRLMAALTLEGWQKAHATVARAEEALATAQAELRVARRHADRMDEALCGRVVALRGSGRLAVVDAIGDVQAGLLLVRLAAGEAWARVPEHSAGGGRGAGARARLPLRAPDPPPRRDA